MPVYLVKLYKPLRGQALGNLPEDAYIRMVIDARDAVEAIRKVDELTYTFRPVRASARRSKSQIFPKP